MYRVRYIHQTKHAIQCKKCLETIEIKHIVAISNIVPAVLT